jgi:nucleotide-binding universal stress UspA family protein
MSERTKPPLRILVAFDAWRHDPGALEMAARLAAARRAELLALVIEDIDLANLAELPFATEIDRFCAAERRLDSATIARRLNAQARQVRRLIDELSARLQVSASLRILRGHYVAVALEAAEEVDITLLSKRMRTQRPTSLVRERYMEMGQRRRSLSGKTVWSLFDGSPAAVRALVVASELAAQSARTLSVLMPARSEAEAAGWQQQVAGLVEANTTRIVIGPPHDPASLLRVMRQTECDLFVVPRQEQELVRRIAESAGCPIVLVL